MKKQRKENDPIIENILIKPTRYANRAGIIGWVFAPLMLGGFFVPSKLDGVYKNGSLIHQILFVLYIGSFIMLSGLLVRSLTKGIVKAIYKNELSKLTVELDKHDTQKVNPTIPVVYDDDQTNSTQGTTENTDKNNKEEDKSKNKEPSANFFLFIIGFVVGISLVLYDLKFEGLNQACKNLSTPSKIFFSFCVVSFIVASGLFLPKISQLIDQLKSIESSKIKVNP